MFKKPLLKNHGLLFIALLAAVILFQLAYGFPIVMPANDNWLMMVRHDWGTHYLGWYFYRNEPWQFPLGNISRYFYPVGTNVGFTDSIPLMAIFFKLLSRILPDRFQYFGIWLLLCYLLTAWYTVRLLQLFRLRPEIILAAVLLVVGNPVLAYRGMHPALCTPWLLIGSLYLYFLDPKAVKPSRILRHQAVLLLLAAAINPYMCVMVGGSLVALCIKLYRYEKAISLITLAGYLGACLGAVIAIWYVTGLITFAKKEDLDVDGAYGLYSLNLNSLFNPGMPYSILPSLKSVSWHQYEGYMYLGLGVMGLILVLIILWAAGLVRKKPLLPSRAVLFRGTALWPLLILLILFALFAITPVISINDKVILRIPVPARLMTLGDVFRASARFFWLPYYVLILLVFVLAGQSKMSRPALLTLFLATIGLQWVDTHHLLTARRYPAGAYEPPIDKRWGPLFSHFDQIDFYPPFEARQLVSMDYQDFCYLAAGLRKPINTGYVARANHRSMNAYSDSLLAGIKSGHLLPGVLYIVTAPQLNYFTLGLQLDSIQLHRIDGYYFTYSNRMKDPGLTALSAMIDGSGKPDSVWRSVLKKNEFYATDRVSDPAGNPVRYQVSSLSIGKSYLTMDGWSFIDSTQNNKGDSTFITLSSPARSYMAPTTLFLRPDVTNFFHRPYLTDAGYKVIAFFDSLPEGQYHLGFAIKDQRGRYICRKTDTVIDVRGPAGK